MSEYYTKKPYDEDPIQQYEEADIGWRWCKDELPTEFGYYPVMWDIDSHGMAYWTGKEWKASTYHLMVSRISQWCKLPEPLSKKKEDES